MLASETTVRGACAYACSKTMLCFARASRAGVGCFASRNPTRSARTDPNVIRMIFGLAAANDLPDSIKVNGVKINGVKVNKDKWKRRSVDRSMAWIFKV